MGDMYGKGKKGKATKLHAAIIRDIGMCERCGGDNFIQCAHIISRRFVATRTDLRNAFCLCAACHRYFTDHPVDFGRFVKERIGDKLYDKLNKMAHAGQKANDDFWEDRILFLEDVRDRMAEGEMTLNEAREYEA